ncbi:uncharacterized protein LOC114516805 [Dendronephthya gigantea]|uniref:uncharacterized protein LOC114516805 n=1 Tax=Dendronephthya gigantea TaxID=151771 RepID=UPI00106CD4E7|nr:uncharacterized protein LOC114516805 [Dendronephthya gigantea]
MDNAPDPANSNPRCEKHDKILKFYCETCKVLVCRYCVDINHPRPEHTWFPLTDVVRQRKEALNISSGILEKEKNDAAESNRKIEEAKTVLKNNATKARDAIMQQQQSILNAFTKKLEKETTSLLDQVEIKYREANTLLSKQQADVKEYFEKAKSSLDFTRNILSSGNAEVLLALKDELEEKAGSIKTERPEFMEPVHDGLLEYHPKAKPTEDIMVNLKFNDLGKIVYPAVQSLFESSTILEDNIEHAKQLVEWVEDKKFSWQLCYRASRDGWKAQDFHKKCDDVGPTVTLVKCGTNVFGGFTDRSWGTSYSFMSIVLPRYNLSNQSFLFSVKNKENMRPMKCPIINGLNYAAIYRVPSSGAIFGNGYDLFISSDAKNNKYSYSNLGYTFQAPSGFKSGAPETRALLAGSYYFTPSEIEVFRS